MSIDKDMKIASLEAELEMANKELKIAHETSKKHRAKYMGLCRRITEAMMGHDEQPQIHHVQPISAERIGEIVEKVRGRG